MSLLPKLERLRKLMDGCSAATLVKMNQWERQIKKKESMAQLRKVSEFKNFYDKAVKEKKRLQDKLHTDRDLNFNQRQNLFNLIDLFDWLIETVDVKTDLVSLETIINKSIQKNKQFKKVKK